MTLNGVMVVSLCYFREFDSFNSRRLSVSWLVEEEFAFIALRIRMNASKEQLCRMWSFSAHRLRRILRIRSRCTKSNICVSQLRMQPRTRLRLQDGADKVSRPTLSSHCLSVLVGLMPLPDLRIIRACVYMSVSLLYTTAVM